MRRPSPRILACLAACGVACSGGRDPILDRADELGSDADGAAAQPAPAAPPPAAAPAPQPAPGTPDPVRPEDPPPGVPDDPPPPRGEGGDPGAQPPAGPQVTLQGAVSVPGWKGGPIRIDVFDGDQQAAAGKDGPRPGIVAVARLEAPGPFSLSVPAGTAQVWVGAFADEDQDGRPGHTDPSGWYDGNPVTVGEGAEGIALTLAPPPPPPAE